MAIDKTAYEQGRKAYDNNDIHNPYNDAPGLHGEKLWGSWNHGWNDRKREEAKHD